MPASRARSAIVERSPVTTRWSSVVPAWMTAAGVGGDRLFAPPAEPKGVAALQAHENIPGYRLGAEQFVNLGLSHRPAATALADVDEPRLRARKAEQCGVDKPVVDDDVGLGD